MKSTVRDFSSLMARSSQSLKSAGYIIVTDERHNVGDPVSSWVISIKSMEGLPDPSLGCTIAM
jgi:hypothetical protein